MQKNCHLVNNIKEGENREDPDDAHFLQNQRRDAFEISARIFFITLKPWHLGKPLSYELNKVHHNGLIISPYKKRGSCFSTHHWDSQQDCFERNFHATFALMTKSPLINLISFLGLIISSRIVFIPPLKTILMTGQIQVWSSLVFFLPLIPS